MNDHNDWCFTWLPGSNDPSGMYRQGLLRDSKWRAGETITVSFLDGDPDLHKKVRDTAMEWVAPNMARLNLDFRRDTNATDIRISFRYAGSWSALGTTCKRITDISKPTMNFGWLKPESPEQELRRVVLHEFGHALGLVHEHQIPDGGIQWNHDRVIRELSVPPHNWSKQTIKQNLFIPYSRSEMNSSKLDSESIMMYPIPEGWTKNGFSTGLNNDLSEADRRFIRHQYP